MHTYKGPDKRMHYGSTACFSNHKLNLEFLLGSSTDDLSLCVCLFFSVIEE